MSSHVRTSKGRVASAQSHGERNLSLQGSCYVAALPGELLPSFRRLLLTESSYNNSGSREDGSRNVASIGGRTAREDSSLSDSYISRGVRWDDSLNASMISRRVGWEDGSLIAGCISSSVGREDSSLNGASVGGCGGWKDGSLNVAGIGGRVGRKDG